ncbi:MAG: DUF4163 domain-containing protein, partial [Actinomycetota bacterium]|nr:DUF4163 domain-containing protein [Actinomycetota bacterium]
MKNKRIIIVGTLIFTLVFLFSFSCKLQMSANSQSSLLITDKEDNSTSQTSNTSITLQSPEDINNDPKNKKDIDSEKGSTQDNSEINDSAPETLYENDPAYDDFTEYFIKPLNLNMEAVLENGFSFELMSIDESNPEENYIIAGTYPSIEGPSGSNYEKFNEEIIAFIETLSSDFRTDVGKTNEELASQATREDWIYTNELDISSSVQLCSSKISSVIFLNYYFTGGAHGITISNPLNYDMKSSKMLELKDIFKKDSGYLNKLSDCCRADLKKQLENIDVAT